MKNYENIPILKPILDYLDVNGECDYYHNKLKTVLTHYIIENNENAHLRKYNIYLYEEIEHIVYSYIFDYFSHYLLDRDVLKLRNPSGAKSREILLNLGIDEDFKNFFEEISPYDAIKILRNLYNERNDIRYKLITYCIDRHRAYLDLFGWFVNEDNYVMKLLNMNVFRYNGVGIPDYMENFWRVDSSKCDNNSIYFIFNDNYYKVDINYFSKCGKKEYHINWSNSTLQKDLVYILSKIDKFCHKKYKYPDIKFERIIEDIYKISLMKSFCEEIDISKYSKSNRDIEQVIIFDKDKEILHTDDESKENLENSEELNINIKNYENSTLICKAEPQMVISISRKNKVFIPKKTDFIKKLKNQKNLGLAGELMVLNYEKNFLISNGKEELLEKVKHVSKEDGDGAGYDILSCDLDGNIKYIEVKTTKRANDSIFNITDTELEFSRLYSSNYYLYRLYNYDIKNNCAEFYSIQGNLYQRLRLKPQTYLANILINGE